MKRGSDVVAQLKIPIENFAFEILGDLPTLMAEHPKGVMVQHLHSWYNESPTRIIKAISILEEKHHIRVYKAANNSSYILPLEAGLPDELGGLSDLQRAACQLLRKICAENKTTMVRTNYAQLARLLKCSATGIRTCIDRLVQLGYLVIVEPSKHGKQNELLLKLGDKLLTPKEPLA